MLHSPSHFEHDASCLHGNLIYKYTQSHGKREKRTEQARGRRVILLQVCVFLIGLFSSPPLRRGCIAMACRGRSDRNCESRVKQKGGGCRNCLEISVWLGKWLKVPHYTNFQTFILHS